jgi:hypothetical protein
MTKLTCLDVECAVADYFSPRTNLIVPNVSWGFLFYEVDLLVVTPAGYCYEVEIKVSRSDLIADEKKTHGHNSKKMRRLYFAIPDYLQSCVEFVPERAGVLVVSEKTPGLNRCRCVRDPQNNCSAPKIDAVERYQVARLGAMRIFTLKNALRAYKLDQMRKKNEL